MHWLLAKAPKIACFCISEIHSKVEIPYKKAPSFHAQLCINPEVLTVLEPFGIQKQSRSLLLSKRHLQKAKTCFFSRLLVFLNGWSCCLHSIHFSAVLLYWSFAISCCPAWLVWCLENSCFVVVAVFMAPCCNCSVNCITFIGFKTSCQRTAKTKSHL